VIEIAWLEGEKTKTNEAEEEKEEERNDDENDDVQRLPRLASEHVECVGDLIVLKLNDVTDSQRYVAPQRPLQVHWHVRQARERGKKKWNQSNPKKSK
jgi:hypothetical protein